MSSQVSNCYYHPERGAVATCAKCGVGVCRDCAVKDEHGKILCYQCMDEILWQEHQEHRKWLKEKGGRFTEGKEFIVPSIVGGLLVAAAGVALYLDPSDLRVFNGHPGIMVAALLFGAYLVFSVPFCYIVLSDRFAAKCDTIYDKIFKCLLKFMISLVSGWAVFTFLWIRFIVRKNKSKNNQAQHTGKA